MVYNGAAVRKRAYSNAESKIFYLSLGFVTLQFARSTINDPW